MSSALGGQAKLPYEPFWLAWLEAEERVGQVESRARCAEPDRW